MLVQEPVQAAIWHCLNNYAYDDAIFLAERLQAEVNTEETIWLLATCYFRNGKFEKSKYLLENCTTPRCRYLYAKSCFELKELSKAEKVLVGTVKNITATYGDIASFAFSLMANICFKTDRVAQGVDALKKSFSLNPFLWTVLENLANHEEKPDPLRAFNSANMSYMTGSNPVINYVNSEIFETPIVCAAHIDNMSTPIHCVQMGDLCMSGIKSLTPITPQNISTANKPRKSIRCENIFPNSLSPLTASFGVIPLDKRTEEIQRNSPNGLYTPQMKSRHFQNKNNRSRSCSKLGRRLIDISPGDNKSISEQAILLQTHSLDGLLLLMKTLGEGCINLSRFECKKAISIFNALPPHHRNTGWVLGSIGKAYYEMNDYKKACDIFEKLRKIDPKRVKNMDIYSSALWQLQRKTDLSCLAFEMSSVDKRAPETWCAIGNSFSAIKHQENAIKFFQRAVQVDPDFAYAYTLLGDEHIANDNLDEGMSCFRNAIRIEPRNYKAWYGIGAIYSKQEKFALAEIHYKKALNIHPKSCVLMSHIGLVQLASKKPEEALCILNKSLGIEPDNPLCKFYRALALSALNKHYAALIELEELTNIAPKEAQVYRLIGKLYEKLGNEHLAMTNFNLALEIDKKSKTTLLQKSIDQMIVFDGYNTSVASTEHSGLRRPSQESVLNNSSFGRSDESF